MGISSGRWWQIYAEWLSKISQLQAFFYSGERFLLYFARGAHRNKNIQSSEARIEFSFPLTIVPKFALKKLSVGELIVLP